MPWVVLRIALRTNAHIYHIHDPELIPIGFVMRWLLSKRVVYDVHEAVPKQIMSKEWLPRWSRRIVSTAYSIIEHFLTRGQAIVLANEGSVADYAESAYLVRNYPLIRKQAIDKTGGTTSKAEPPLLVYVGGVSRIRGADIYIQLAHHLVRRKHDFQMFIIGPYSNTDGIRLTETIETLGLQKRVQLTGRMNYEKAMDLVSKATIGLCLLLPVPNYTTCLATKILEYMMNGIPVLASDFDCWRRYVEGERAGKMANPCDIHDVVEVCETLLADPEELRAMGERGAEAVRSRLNWSSEFDNLQRCYRDLLEGSSQIEK